MALEQPPARVLVHCEGVVLVDDVAAIGYAILLPGSAGLDTSVEEVDVSVQRELFHFERWSRTINMDRDRMTIIRRRSGPPYEVLYKGTG